MKILIVGSGGREHAIIKKIKQNKNVSEIYAIPGNGGIERDAICIDIKATDIYTLAYGKNSFAGLDYTNKIVIV